MHFHLSCFSSRVNCDVDATAASVSSSASTGVCSDWLLAPANELPDEASATDVTGVVAGNDGGGGNGVSTAAEADGRTSLD